MCPLARTLHEPMQPLHSASHVELREHLLMRHADYAYCAGWLVCLSLCLCV
jgi:hypothetical protein